MTELQPLFAVLGVAGVAHLSGHVLEQTGNGNLGIFVKIGAYCACAYIAWDTWWVTLRYVAGKFGIHL